MKIEYNSNKILQINNTDGQRLSFMACLIIFCLFLVTSANILESVTNISYESISLFCWGTMVLFFLINLFAVVRNTDQRILLFIITVGLLFIFNYLAFGYSEGFEYSVKYFLFYALPGCVVFCAIKEYNIFLRYAIVFSKIILPVAFIITIINRNNPSLSVYSMSFAYSLLFPILILLYDYYKTSKFLVLVFVLFGIVSIVLVGSRGPLLGIIFLFVTLLLKKFFLEKSMIKIICFMILFFILFFAYDYLLLFSLKLLEDFGWYSRTLRLLADDMYHDSGRLFLYQMILNDLERNPLAIHGIAGEYQLIGGYAHNIVLELLYSFGIVIGGVIVVSLILNTGKTIWYFIIRGTDFDTIKFLMLVASLPGLMVSGTFWGNVYFWTWLLLQNNNHLSNNKFKFNMLSNY